MGAKRTFQLGSRREPEERQDSLQVSPILPDINLCNINYMRGKLGKWAGKAIGDPLALPGGQ